MADPLKLLHDYAIGRRTMREIKQGHERYFVFGDVAYPRDVKTNLTVYSRPNEYYTLEALLCLWENRDMPHTAYVKDASGRGMQCVTRPDRRELLAYLKGEREQPPQSVDLLAPIPAPIPVSRLIDQNEPEIKKPRFDGEENRQRIQNLLMGTVTEDSKNSSEGVRDLSDKLTADKIAALKNKRKKNMARNTIKAVDDFPVSMELDVSEMGTDVLDREMKNRERVWKNRRSIMESASKDFTPILSLLHSLKMREEAIQRQKISAPPPRVANERNQVQSVGYSRYDQERFNKDQTAGFKIETGLSFQGTSLKSMSASGAKPMAADTAVSLATKMATPSSSETTSRLQKKQSRTPIIIIPAAGTSLITMFNVRDILQDMRFVSTEERKTTSRRENEVLLQRTRDGGVTVPYRVVENPLKLNDDEWSRVVAVFVQGPAWQFKGWRWGGNPTDIFANVAAFHLMFDDQRLDNNVAKWSVNVLKLSKSKRHLDRAILAKFWQLLDKHIVKNKPHLRY